MNRRPWPDPWRDPGRDPRHDAPTLVVPDRAATVEMPALPAAHEGCHRAELARVQRSRALWMAACFVLAPVWASLGAVAMLLWLTFTFE